jgi:predicted ester cyclase
MNLRRNFMLGGSAAALFGAMLAPARAEVQSIPHEYTAYEKLIRQNVSQFHVFFNSHEFTKNGELVADNIHVNSNSVEVIGRAAFVDRISRFVGPFPDVKIQDTETIVEGNRAVVRYILTGTHEGDLTTPEGIVHATYNKIKVDGAEFFTFDSDGKLVDLITIERLDQLFQQLKALK